jgi:hypothetical protein
VSPKVQFSSFTEYFHDFHPHLMFYSWNGCGKTTLASKTGMRTVLLDCGDAGVVTLKDADRSKLKIIRIKSCFHYLDVMESINRSVDKIDLLVVDTLTGLQSMGIKEVKGKKAEMNQRKWGSVGSRVIECISETKNFPKDVIYLAQEKRKSREEESGTMQVIGPSLIPSVREYLSSSIDWMGRLYIDDDGKRKISFILTETIEAKDRGDVFPKTLVIPREGVYQGLRKRIVSSIHE